MRLSALVAVVLLGLGTVRPAHAQVTMRWRFQPGDAWELRSSREVRASTETLGGTARGPSADASEELQTVTLRATVRGVDADGRASVEWTILRIQLTTEGGATAVNWDSSRPGTAPLPARAQLLEPLVGLRLTGVVSARGELSGISGLDSVAARAVGRGGPGFAAAVERSAHDMFDGEAGRELFLGGLPLLPD